MKYKTLTRDESEDILFNCVVPALTGIAKEDMMGSELKIAKVLVQFGVCYWDKYDVLKEPLEESLKR